MDARWKIRAPGDPSVVRRLAEEIRIPEAIASLLILRGATDYQSAKVFLNPDQQPLISPWLMNDMKVAVERIVRARENQEKVLVYGDYDVDGTNSASLLHLFLRKIGCDSEVYIPGRLQPEYGLSYYGIDYASEYGATLMLVVDCGITAVKEVEYAREKGIEVIICDHHQPIEEIPRAVAVLDPLQPKDHYPFKHLSAAGVAYKLIQGVAEYFNLKDVPEEYLDFVAIAAAADIVPMVEENRYLVYKGLKLINENPRPGIRALIEKSRLQPGSITAQQIVFVMAPRINAAGRVGDPKRAVDLLTTDDPVLAGELADELERENRLRRDIDEKTFKEAQTIAQAMLEKDADLPLILHNDNWHPGVIAIVASRLVEKFHRPTILLTTIDGVAKGSARSVAGFNIYEALKRCEHHLLQFGGHIYAAGLALEIPNIAAFREEFHSVSRDLITEDMLLHEITAEAVIELADIRRYNKDLKRFAPFGPGNQRPVFMARSVAVADDARIVGRDHVKFAVQQGGAKYFAIGYNLGHRFSVLPKGGERLDVLFTIEEPNPNDPYDLQIRLKDFRWVGDARTEEEVLKDLSQPQPQHTS